jgi:hypothetical protein
MVIIPAQDRRPQRKSETDIRTYGVEGMIPIYVDQVWFDTKVQENRKSDRGRNWEGGDLMLLPCTYNVGEEVLVYGRIPILVL